MQQVVSIATEQFVVSVTAAQLVVIVAAVGFYIFGDRLAGTDSPSQMGQAPISGSVQYFTVFPEPVPAPDTAFETEAGAQLTLADLRGDYVLLNFWATFCAAFELAAVDSRPEDDEVIEVIPTPLEDALEMVWRGELTDAKSAIALLHASRLVGQL